MFLLDTNLCIQILNQRSPHIQKQIQQHPPEQIALCSIVKAATDDLYELKEKQRQFQKTRAFTGMELVLTLPPQPAVHFSHGTTETRS